MSKNSLTFNGSELSWQGHGTFKATSGQDGFQEAKNQNKSDLGPIPEGKYSLLAVVAAGSAFDKKGRLDGRQGIERLAEEGSNQVQPPGWKAPVDASDLIADWGHNRVRLNIIHIDHRNARHRNGFYIHDSHKGHTHGCIEVEHKFFDHLRSYAADQTKLQRKSRQNTLLLTVKYASDSTSTNGKTKF